MTKDEGAVNEELVSRLMTVSKLRQQAEQAQNQLQTIRIQAQQAVAQANGTANSINLIENKLERSPNYLKYYALQKWNGILPQVTSGGTDRLSENVALSLFIT